LLEDKTTPVPDQAAFRVDLSEFMTQQSDRTRQAMALLAAGYRQTEVADRLGCTPSAICQRVKRAEREWMAWQAEPDIPPGLRVVTAQA
jgi:DNA-directed RNA polymerase specialized sigma24 family protein